MLAIPDCEIDLTYTLELDDGSEAPSFAKLNGLKVTINSEDSSNAGKYSFVIVGKLNGYDDIDYSLAEYSFEVEIENNTPPNFVPNTFSDVEVFKDGSYTYALPGVRDQ